MPFPFLNVELDGVRVKRCASDVGLEEDDVVVALATQLEKDIRFRKVAAPNDFEEMMKELPDRSELCVLVARGDELLPVTLFCDRTPPPPSGGWWDGLLPLTLPPPLPPKSASRGYPPYPFPMPPASDERARPVPPPDLPPPPRPKKSRLTAPPPKVELEGRARKIPARDAPSREAPKEFRPQVKGGAKAAISFNLPSRAVRPTMQEVFVTSPTSDPPWSPQEALEEAGVEEITPLSHPASTLLPPAYAEHVSCWSVLDNTVPFVLGPVPGPAF